jgi:amino acid adenylation domain-containing protein
VPSRTSAAVSRNPVPRLRPSPAEGECLHHAFERWAALSPDSVALIAGTERVTYGELDARAERIARELRARGVGPEVPVGICLERGPEMVAAVLGVLKAGGAYVPLDPDYPRERLGFVLEDARLPVLVSREALLDRLPGFRGDVVSVDAAGSSDAGAAPHLAPRTPHSPDGLAYVVYTSGSTGRPKGVQVSHRTAVASLRGIGALLPDDVLAGTAATTSLGFDPSVYDLFLPLGRGGAAILAANPLELASLPARDHVTLLLTVPSAAAALVRAGALPASLRVLCLGAEALKRGLADQLYGLPHLEAVYNLYGPTEDTVYSTWSRVPRADDRPPAIGRPMAGRRAYLLDEGWDPVAEGDAGEMFLGGVGVTRGYLGRPDLTADRFLPDPFSPEPGARMYRTGDRARRRPDGEMEFVGRTDHQLKIRGHRIEPGEVEAALAAAPGVRDAAVAARPDASGETRLVAWLVAREPGALSIAAVRSFLRERLPVYMVPGAWVEMDALPLNPNGKTDRAALPAPTDSELAAADAYVAPRTPTERVLAGVWAEVLGVGQVGAEDDFLELGGHSLLAMRVLTRVREALGVELLLGTVLEARTVAALAERVDALRGSVEAAGAGSPLRRYPDDDGPVPLSFAQQRLWVLDRMDPGSPVYNVPAAVALSGPLDGAALGRALDALVRRHEALRTVVRTRDGEPVQVVEPAAPVPLPLDDLSGAGPERFAALERDEAHRPFDLSRGPLFRARLVRLGAAEHVLLLTVHHAVSDGWSLEVLFHDLAALYGAFAAGRPSPLPELPVRYTDFSMWQREHVTGQGLAQLLAYWEPRLRGAPLLELPADHPRPPRPSFRGGIHRFRIPPGVSARLRALAPAAGATPFMALLAAFKLFLARHTGEWDVVVGSPIAGRTHRETEGMVGFFANTLALRTGLGGDPTFREALGRVRETTLGAYAHDDLPFERLVEALGVERDPGRNPVFQVVFVFRDRVPAVEAAGVRMALRPGDTDTAKFDLGLELTEDGDTLDAAFEFAVDLFEPATVARMAERFVTLLEGIAADPDARLSGIALLTPDERRTLEGWSRSGAPEAPAGCLHRFFEAQADRVPDAVAVEMGSEALTYAELDRRANRLARTLRARGVGSDAPVGICMRRSPEMVVAMLAVLKAGGAYLPLDPEYPAERLEYMLRDSGARVLVAGDGLAERLPGFDGAVVEAPLLSSPSPARGEGEHDDGRLRVEVSPEHLAFVFYTSGSTGMPKGTEVPHRAVPGFFRGADYVRFAEDAVYLQHSSISWDAMVFELWAPLLTGARCVLYDGTVPELPRVEAAIREHGVDTLWLPAGLFNVVVDDRPELLRGVRQLVVGGEAVSAGHARRALEAYPGLRLVNGYGPSETTVFATCWPVPAGFGGASVPIGRPVGDRRVHVLDASLTPAPIGVPGELFVGGPGVARGYRGRPGMTAERFVPDPFGVEPGARLYRTGDRVRWRADGALEFLGRVDQQVKVRGFRIEPEEVEAALARHPRVREAAVAARPDGAGVLRLAAYVVPEGAVEAAELAEFARASLPEYMVPSAFVTLDALPLTRNGKTDRRALPAPEWERETGWIAPRTPDEEILAGIWAEVLGVERVGVRDDFFALGGHSLSATRVVSRVARVLGAEPPLRALFEAPTLGAFAARVAALRGDEIPAAPPLVPLSRMDGERLPLSFAQERLWFVEQLRPGGATYAIADRMRLSGPLDVEALRRALEEIVRRHEALRTVFAAADGRPVQQVLPPAPLALEAEALSGASPAEVEAAVAHRAREEALRPFDLERGPLFRVRLLRLGAEEHLLVVGMHHVVSDGWSMGVFARELSALYGAFACGGSSPLPPLPVQYADFAAWQRTWLSGDVLERQLAWWRGRLAGAPRALELPTDRPRPPVQSGRGAVHRFALPAELYGEVRALSREAGATPFMTLLAAFQVLLAKGSGQDDVVVGTPIANRTRPELEGLIGFFVNTLALRARLDDAPAFRDLLARTRDETLGAFAHQDLPFDRLVEALAPERDLGRNPLVQAVFALHAAQGGAPELPGLRVRVEEEETHTAKFDLALTLDETGDGLAGRLEYATDLFDADTAARMAEHFVTLVAGAVAHPDAPVSELTLLDDAARRQVLEEWSGESVSPSPEWAPVHTRVLARAAAAPHTVAVVCGGTRMTYGELAARSACLAAELGRRGAGPESRVALLAHRSPELVVAMLAVLRAGAAYLPVDPSTPVERVATILEDAGVELVLAEEALAERLAGYAGEVVVLGTPLPPAPSPTRGEGEHDDGTAQEARPRNGGHRGQVLRASSEPGGGLTPEHLAYVIYTSGSTGTPKGVAVTHGGLANLTDWHRNAFCVTDADRATQLAGLGFDASVWETWPYLAAGAELHLVADEEVRTSPEALRDFLVERRITVAFAPTPLAEAVLGLEWPADAPLRALLTGGDALRVRPPAGTPFALVNNYGPTENTVVATSGVVPGGGDGHAPTIGRPVRGVRTYVLDAALQPLPAGVPGELCLGGAGVARGYLGRPDATAAAFVPDPFSGEPGARLYRTGDRVRWTSGGELEFLGRLDRQAKVRGFRVEPGEVEAALLAHAAVREAAVMVHDASGDARLVAYLVPSSPASGAAAGLPDALRVHLAARLPEYMVPSAFVALDALPLTPSGKTDRAALPAPDLAGGSGLVAPRTPTEEVLAAVWGALLGRERVGTRENFFALGGHSLLATQAVSRVRQLFGTELPLRTLFEAPTVERLAERVDAARREQAGGAVPPLRPVARSGPVPASFAQERLWFLERMRPGEATYAIPLALRLSGALDVEALRRALEEVVRRHEALRTVFATHGGRPVQVVRPAGRLDLPVETLSGGADALRARLRAEAEAPFDLETGPLFRARLLRLDEGEHVLLLSMHHVVSDGWSVGVILDELSALYGEAVTGEPAALVPLPVQYADFAVWQREWLSGETLERQLAWWRGRLAGAPALLELPTDRPRPAVQSARGATVAFHLPREVADAVRELGRREGATPFMTLLAAWQLLLARWSGQDDVVTGTPVAGRTRRELEGLVGFFVNSLPLRAELGGDPTVHALVAGTRDAMLGALAHQDVPFERLVEELRTERSLAHAPVFQVMFTVQSGPPAAPELAGVRARLLLPETAAAKYDLTLSLAETGDGLAGELEYAVELFDAATAERIAERYRLLLQGMVAGPEGRVSDLPLLAAGERETVLHAWSGADAPASVGVPVHRRIAAQAARRPHAVAVVAPDATLTYGELVARANRIANHLRARGVGPETRVAVCLERGADLVAAQLGVLAAGAAYLPLDPAYPAERIAYAVEDAGAPVLLTDARTLARLPAMPVEAVALDGDRHRLAAESVEAPTVDLAPESAAYAVYTSGSTGRPKGVVVTHGGLASLTDWHLRAFGLTEADRTTQVAGPGFDAAAWETWPALAAGAELHVVEDETRAVPAALRDRLLERGITVAFLPTPLAEAVLGLEWPADAPLRTLLTGGDALRVRPRAGLPFALVNAYGPTENTVVATAGVVQPVGDGRAPGIGRPADRVRAYVLDASLQPVPPGVPGELCLGGASVARGYLGRPDATAAAFVPDPFCGEPGARMYRTGDRVRWLADGTLEFLGRSDRQVKVRGFRIETGEIEAVLAEHPGVAEAVVEARGEGVARRLVGWVVPAAGAAATSAELRAHLAARVPDYMVPGALVFLERIPVTPNGKLDRAALPEPAAESTAPEAPRNDTEARIAAIWAELLRLERVGVEDNFFDLGGHSLLLAQLHARLAEELGRELPIVDLFRFPTVASLAEHLAGERTQGAKAGRGSERGAARRALARSRGGRGRA